MMTQIIIIEDRKEPRKCRLIDLTNGTESKYLTFIGSSPEKETKLSQMGVGIHSLLLYNSGATGPRFIHIMSGKEISIEHFSNADFNIIEHLEIKYRY